jgi:hypothetical protein
MLLKLDEIDEALKRFEKDGVPRMGDVNRRNKAAINWTQTQKDCKEVKKEITTTVGLETDKCKQEIKIFEDLLKTFDADLRKRPFYFWKTGKDESFRALDETNDSLGEYKTKLEYLNKLSLGFAIKDGVEIATKSIDQISLQLNTIKSLWDHIKKCIDNFDSFLLEKWNELNASNIEDEIKALAKALQQMKVDRKSNV